MENDHDDNSKPINYQQLMVKADAFYKKRLMDKVKPWESNPVEDRLSALQTDVKKVQSKFAATPQKSPKKQGGGGDPKPQWLKNNKKPDPIWDVKVWNGRAYHWYSKENGGKCPGMWRAHNPKSCTYNEEKPSAKKRASTPKDKQANKRKKLIAQEKRLLAAQQA